jgi:hypothetical protein
MADVNPPRLDPVSMAWNTVASYPSYEEAQAAVDRLSDERFPVENLDIVGSGLRLVERVTGRLTNARAAAAGAASGAWFGLFIGLLVGLFTRGPAWIGLIIGGLLIGAAWARSSVSWGTPPPGAAVIFLPRGRCPAPVGGCALAGEWRSRRGALSRPAQAGCLLIPPGHWLALGAGQTHPVEGTR